jgi:chromosomal replication initiation ATPase DnaA
MPTVRPHINSILASLNERDLLEPAKAIAKKHHVSVRDMLGPTRYPELSSARREFWHYLTSEAQFSTKAVERLLGVDHSSVIYGVRKHVARLDKCDADDRKSV